MIAEGSTKRTAGGASTGQPEIKKNRVDRELLPRYLASSMGIIRHNSEREVDGKGELAKWGRSKLFKAADLSRRDVKGQYEFTRTVYEVIRREQLLPTLSQQKN